jgi:hypothetical protein
MDDEVTMRVAEIAINLLDAAFFLAGLAIVSSCSG